MQSVTKWGKRETRGNKSKKKVSSQRGGEKKENGQHLAEYARAQKRRQEIRGIKHPIFERTRGCYNIDLRDSLCPFVGKGETTEVTFTLNAGSRLQFTFQHPPPIKEN